MYAKARMFCAVTILVSGWAAGAARSETMDPMLFGLYNTGVGSSGAALEDVTIGFLYMASRDYHYTLVGWPSNFTDSSEEVYKIIETTVPGAWIPNSAISTWVNPGQFANIASNDMVPYSYRTSLNLSGLSPSQVTIHGRFAADDSLTDLRVNGSSAGITGGGFGSWTNFTLNSGFQNGINNLDFDVVNNQAGGAENPSGLRVEFMDIDITPVSSLSGLRFLSSNRMVNTTVDAWGGTGWSSTDTHNDRATAFDPFTSTQHSAAGVYGEQSAGMADASQNSDVLGAILHASGNASSSGYGTPDSDPLDNWITNYQVSVTSLSQYRVTFLVDALSYFRLQGETSSVAGSSSVTVTGPAGTLYTTTVDGLFDTILTLEPGTYTLEAIADASVYYTGPAGTASAAFDLTFTPVPEPATMAMLALGAVTLLRRRRDGGGSRPATRAS